APHSATMTRCAGARRSAIAARNCAGKWPALRHARNPARSDGDGLRACGDERDEVQAGGDPRSGHQWYLLESVPRAHIQDRGISHPGDPPIHSHSARSQPDAPEMEMRPYELASRDGSEWAAAEQASAFLSAVYRWMCVGLTITAGTA